MMEPEKINGRTPEQIKEAASICVSSDACQIYKCPYEVLNDCREKMIKDLLSLVHRLEEANASLKANMEHEAARSIQMVNEIADMTMDLDINVLFERAGMEPYTDGTLSESFVLRIALKRALDERDALREKVPRRISVEERLPEKLNENNQVYLTEKVIGFDGECAYIGQFKVYKYDGHKTFFDGNCFREDITHWMPLPKPTENKEESNRV